MRSLPKLKPTLADLLIVFVVLLLAAGTGYYSLQQMKAPAAVAEVSADGVVITELSLSENGETELESHGVHLTVVVQDGSVFVESSDCPNQNCVQSGRIHRGGESIVCLPGRVSITLKSNDGDALDLVIG